MERKQLIAPMVFIFLVLMAAGALSADGKFPHRADYPLVETVDTHQLYADLKAEVVVVVDVRSKLEFDVIHVDGAVHIPVSKGTFSDQVKVLASENPGKKLAFYCNGTTCLKSYKAATKAMIVGVSDVQAYDGGIPEWARVWPETTILLGSVIEDADSQLIPKAEFKTRCLDYEAFVAMSTKPGVLVVDVRDNFQKSGSLPGLAKVRPVALDIFIPNFVVKKAEQDKTLLIFDQVGKQIKWLQYYMQEYGYTDYYFLSGGATKVLKSQSYRS